MPQIITNLWFDTEAHEAAEYYCSIFPDSEITASPTTPRPARARRGAW